MGCAPQFELVPVNQLVPYVNNAKKHGAEQIAQLRASIREFGFLSPCVIDQDYNVLAGHARLLAAKAEGMDAVPCVFAGDLTEAQKKAYILADNRLSEFAEWDEELLKLELLSLDEMGFDFALTGFDDSFLTTGDEEEGEAQEDDYDGTVPDDCPYADGDVFRLGRHTLVCGSCIDPAVMSRLNAGGGLVSLFLTDPPYGVDYVGKTQDALTIENDALDSAGLEELLTAAFHQADSMMAPGAAFYLWHASSMILPVLNACDAVDWEIRETLIWNKNQFVLGRQDYQWKHEPCFYGWKGGAPHYWAGGRKQSTVIECDKPLRNGEHPTMKPIVLFDQLIKNSTKKGEIVLDLFGGSGTTLLACEQNGRTCCMAELDPRYCAVIIERWEKLTGAKVELLKRN